MPPLNVDYAGLETATVGMPATYCIGSDTYAGKISHVSPSGAYVLFVRDGSARAERFNRGKDGTYRQSSGYLRLGIAETYRDRSF